VETSGKVVDVVLAFCEGPPDIRPSFLVLSTGAQEVPIGNALGCLLECMNYSWNIFLIWPSELFWILVNVADKVRGEAWLGGTLNKSSILTN